MNQQKVMTHKKVSLAGLVILFCTIATVFIATLYPFNFSLTNNFSLSELFDSFHNSSSFQDLVNNVLLFMPFGFAAANLLQRLSVKKFIQIIFIFLASASLSLTVEILQIFLPSRTPTPADIFNNTFGGCLGLICFYLWDSRHFQDTINQIKRSKLRKSPKKIMGFFLVYLLSSLLISLIWQGTTSLSNWNFNYHLVVGNEYTGDRPWQGYISKLYITDQALSTHEVHQGLSDDNYLFDSSNSLLVNYQFPESLQNPTEQAPKLLWQGKPIIKANVQNLFLNSQQWLKTAEPVRNINQRISEKSEFTLSVTLATDKLQQAGPARIISISDSTLRRNFTLSQDGQNLELRLRTPITGENGSEIHLIVPQVFTDKKFHQILVTYAKANLKVYVDKIQHAYVFNLLALIPFYLRLVYYGLTFVPLGIVMAILTLLARTKIVFAKILIICGIMLPSLILESCLVSESGKSLSWKNLVLGIVFTAGTMLFLKVRSSYLKARV